MTAASLAGVRIRRARLSDAAAVAATMRASVRALARGTYDARRIARWSSLPPLYHAWAMTSGGETYLVAEREGRVLGYAALRGREVTAVFVRPAVAARGVGRALLRALERLARRRAMSALFARAALGAVGFYERAGFHRGRPTSVPLPGGDRLPVVLVRKALPAAGRRGSAAPGEAPFSARGRGPRSSRRRPRRRAATRARRA